MKHRGFNITESMCSAAKLPMQILHGCNSAK
jgi:hypothetical protein